MKLLTNIKVHSATISLIVHIISNRIREKNNEMWLLFLMPRKKSIRGHKEMSSILADHWPIAPSHTSPNAGGWGEGGRGLSKWVYVTWSPNKIRIFQRTYDNKNTCFYKAASQLWPFKKDSVSPTRPYTSTLLPDQRLFTRPSGYNIVWLALLCIIYMSPSSMTMLVFSIFVLYWSLKGCVAVSRDSLA